MKQGLRAQKFILPHWWTSVIWRMPNWRQMHQKYKGRIVLRGDIVKDDSGSHAVFTEQGSSASQMTAAKVMDIISRLQGCAGQAADAVSADTQVKWKMLTNCSKFPNRSVQTFGYAYQNTSGLNHGPVWKIQPFRLSEICTVIIWQDYYGKGNLRKSYWSTVGRRFPIENAYSFTVKKGLFLSVYVDDIKLAGKKQNIDPMWKVLNKEVDLGEPTSFLDHVYQVCSQRQCEISKDVVDNYRTMFESRISAGATKNHHVRKICVFLRGPAIWTVLPRNVWNDIVSWQTGRLNNSTKYQVHALMTIISKRKKWNLLENCHKYALKF